MIQLSVGIKDDAGSSETSTDMTGAKVAFKDTDHLCKSYCACNSSAILVQQLPPHKLQAFEK